MRLLKLRQKSNRNKKQTQRRAKKNIQKETESARPEKLCEQKASIGFVSACGAGCVCVLVSMCGYACISNIRVTSWTV